jgi:hypothetical protein
MAIWVLEAETRISDHSTHFDFQKEMLLFLLEGLPGPRVGYQTNA